LFNIVGQAHQKIFKFLKYLYWFKRCEFCKAN